MANSPAPDARARPYFAHESAYVDDGAQIGDGTKIWHFCHVSSGAKIGAKCVFGQNVFVANRVTIGDGVKVQNNVSLYEGVVLEDYVFCGPSMVFTNVKIPRSAFPRNTSDDYLTTRVCHGASIGANATVVCGVTIGRWAFVGAGAVVTKDVPARRVGWSCECGEPLGDPAPGKVTCPECKKSYRLDANGVAPQTHTA